MRDIFALFLHVIVTVIRLAKPGGLRSVVAESADSPSIADFQSREEAGPEPARFGSDYFWVVQSSYPSCTHSAVLHRSAAVVSTAFSSHSYKSTVPSTVFI